MICKNEQCLSKNFAKKGFSWRAGKKIQRRQCCLCGATQTEKD